MKVAGRLSLLLLAQFAALVSSQGSSVSPRPPATTTIPSPLPPVTTQPLTSPTLPPLPPPSATLPPPATTAPVIPTTTARSQPTTPAVITTTTTEAFPVIPTTARGDVAATTTTTSQVLRPTFSTLPGANGNNTAPSSNGVPQLTIIVLSIMAVAIVVASVGIWVFRRKGLAKPSLQFQNRLDLPPATPTKDMTVSMEEEYEDKYHQQSRVNFVTETTAPSQF